METVTSNHGMRTKATRKTSAKAASTTNTKPKTAKKQTAEPKLKKPSAKKRENTSDASIAQVLAAPVKAMDFSTSLASKPVAIVVGASSGIGYHTALRLFRQGYAVYNIARTDAEPQKIHNLHADVCTQDELATAIASVQEREGRIDALIYSAGCSLACPFEHIAEQDFRQVFEVNYFGLVKALRAVIPIMRAQGGGRIVAVSSLAASAPIPFDAPYSASKAAVDMTLRSLAIELYPYNIKLTSVQPGGVHTRFTYKRKVYPEQEIGSYTEAMQKAVAKLDQTEQNGMEPRDVACFIAGLLEDKNPPVTTPVGFKDCATRAVAKLLPTALTDYLNRMAWN